ADGTHVIIYTGDRETALMKATAYNFFKELMRQAELIDSADPLITVQIPDTNGVVKAYFNERTKEDTAYIYGALNKVDISANITFDVLEDEIHFWVGDINKKTLDIEISPSQFYSQYLDSLLIPIPVVSQGTTVTGNTFNINITTSLTEDCQIDLCSGGSAVPGQYNYLFIVSDMDGTVLMSDFIDVADAAPDSNWYFGDDSATGGRLIGSLSIAGYAISGDIQSNEVLSTIISRSLTIPINFTQIQLQVNNIFFNISVEKETYTKTVTASFKSYYPLIMTGFETAGVPERFDLGFPCLFTFTAQSGSVIITKPSPCVNT
ncbi:MAG: hypothetical protein KKE20_04285, partial [Nanoarchaeota archaeon]|nr:hypothetical protein [Nanoarchaeota archaeon]